MNWHEQVKEVVKDPGVQLSIDDAGIVIIVHGKEESVDKFLTWQQINDAKHPIIITTVSRLKRDVNGLPFYLSIVK